jgi:hypothetical protein
MMHQGKQALQQRFKMEKDRSIVVLQFAYTVSTIDFNNRCQAHSATNNPSVAARLSDYRLNYWPIDAVMC